LTDRVPTGSTRLDEILNGGLLKNAINLITGVPGSGKTILSQQVVFRNATKERPALYLTTLSEPLDKVLRYGESLTFFNRDAVQDGRVIYEDVGPQLGEEGLGALTATVDRALREMRPGLVVIDSVRSLHAIAPDSAGYRQFLFDLVRRLTGAATTSIWNAPYSRSEVLDEPEAAIADAILALDVKQVGARETRVLQVLKLRGSGYRTGEHMYRVTGDGLQAFPRLAEAREKGGYDLSPSLAGTGIGAVDEILGAGGGYWAGACTLIAGPTGVGKTLMGLHFLYRGAEAGEPGILATFQENETQLARIVSSFGWSISDPNVHVLSRGLVDMNVDEWVYELLDLVEKTNARRIVIDSLLDVANAAGDPIRFREWMFSMTQRFTRAGVSLMLIIEVPDLFQLYRVSEDAISHLSDNVILLQYVQEDAKLSRALTILKTRAMRHQPMVRRYEITNEGFVLGDVISLSR
jgi:circadian clock protein KaiC